MSSPFPEGGDFSMWVYWRSGERLITREIVLALANRLVLNKFGAADLEDQLPFAISETETTWVIAGSKSLLLRPRADGPPVFGKTRLVVSKEDCEIVSFDVRSDTASAP